MAVVRGVVLEALRVAVLAVLAVILLPVVPPALAAIPGEALQAPPSMPGEVPSLSSGEPLTLVQAVGLARQNSPAIREAEANRDAARAGKREAWLNHLSAIEAKEAACHPL